MTDEEFWDSTLAKVTALQDVKINEWGRKRDYFPALIASILHSTNAPRGSRRFSASELLLHQYPPERVIITSPEHDPDFGALGDWKSLKKALKDRTNRQTDRGPDAAILPIRR